MKQCGFDVGLERPFFLIAGPCVIESLQLQLDTAGTLKEITSRLGIPFIFKSSFDKANRTSGASFRGPGMEAGLKILDEVKRQIGVPVLTDVHEYTPMDEVAAVVDVLQTPAFLCRQTDFIQKVAAAGRPVNIKKGQFLSPWEMKHVSAKAQATGNEAIMVCAAAPMASPAASANSCRSWPAPRSRWAWPVSSWKPIRTRTRPCPMAPTPGRGAAWKTCWPRCRNWMRW